MQGWRTNMEDSHIAISELGEAQRDVSLFAVFDGHGGREVAAFCSEHMVEEIRRQQSTAVAAEDCDSDVLTNDMWGDILVKSFHAMDDMLRSPEHQKELCVLKQTADAKPGGPAENLRNIIQTDLALAKARGALSKEAATQLMMKMAVLRKLEGHCEEFRLADANRVGCTAVCVLLTESFFICANAGDSRAVLCRAGAAVELSRDHKPNDTEERRRIEAAGGWVQKIPVSSTVHYRVNGNLNLSRAIGDLDYKKQLDLSPEAQIIAATPDIVCLEKTAEDDFLVIACDGIWDVKTNQEVCDFVASKLNVGKAIPDIINELLDECCAQDVRQSLGLGGDNMTCIIVQLQSQ